MLDVGSGAQSGAQDFDRLIGDLLPLLEPAGSSGAGGAIERMRNGPAP